MAKNYDSEFCGSLPLNFINHIQPHGCLIVVDQQNFEIVQVSQNVGTMLGLGHESLLHRILPEFLPEAEFLQLRDKLSPEINEKLPFSLSFRNGADTIRCHALVHAPAGNYILELEPAGADAASPASFVSIYQEIKYVMAAVQQAATVEDICNIAVTELKKLSGFDRIMVYRFDEHWNGTVISEVLEEGMEPYLGLRFPASDVPRQARELYQKNPYRLIPDRQYGPVKLYPVINPVTQSFLDLSDCNLRSIAGVHLEYLKNMGVTASMSTRIIIEGKLWGLISCHHREAKYLNYEQCSVFELLSGVIANRLAAVRQEADFRLGTTLQHIHNSLVEQLYTKRDVFEALTEGEATIMDLLNVTGAAIAVGRELHLSGQTPEQSEIQDLILWLQLQPIHRTFTTESISELYEGGNQYAAKASGMIVLPLNNDRGEYILGFRPEVIQLVNWGGNPNEAVQFEADGRNYHPRNSFRLWQQTVKNSSLPWKSQEINMAENFRNVLLEFTWRQHILNRQ